ncbi:MAG: DUF1579 family protein [Anaerolineae bacterium]|nr:DUF1579 family protein [Anaerolineae bacterium]
MTDDLPPEARQFDFWLGEWDVTWGEADRGTNTIRAVLDDRVILENFDGEQATPLRGMSVSTYNRALGKWQQTWVDNQGSYLDFVGELQDGRMILMRHAALNGRPIMQRMVWYNITPDELDWNWERSEDAGATWSLQWHIHYHRKAAQA